MNEGRALPWTRVLGVLVALAVGLIALAVTPAEAQVDPANNQQVVRLVGSYEIQPERGRVVVTEEISVSNVKGNQQSGNTITSFFWTGHVLWVPADAEDLSIAVEGRELEWEVADTVSGIDIIDASFFRNLNLGQTQVIDVTYSLPTYPPGDGERRINSALFDVELVICCNFESIDLTVLVPDEFEVDRRIGLPFQIGRAGANTAYTFADDEVGGDYTELLFTRWAGFNEAGLDSKAFTLGSVEAAVVHPPDDAAWADELVAVAGPLASQLEELVGSPLPVEDLTLRQGANPDFGTLGVDGPFDEPVPIPRSYGSRALAVTLANAWLSDGPFTDERVSRGLAIALADGAVEAADVAPLGLASRPPGAADAELVEVFDEIRDEIGMDGLGRLVTMAQAGELAYAGPGDPATTSSFPGDWRGLVDLLEFRLDAPDSAALVADRLLTADEVEQFERRNEAVERYEAIEGRADSVPLGIRQALSVWDFDRADELIDAAEVVLDDRERILEERPNSVDDEELALASAWTEAETTDDVAAVGQTITDRERSLERADLLRTLGIGGGMLLVLLAGLGAFLYRRRSKADVTGGDQPPAPLAVPVGAEAGVPPASADRWTPPSGPPPVAMPDDPTIDVAAPVQPIEHDR
jgi:hypothetical protein